ncbi:hypothetical protein [Nonomuraea sp. NPDC001699]
MAPHADGAEPIWCVYRFQPPAGMEIHHAIPHALLEWRCALYGLDPDDVPTLLDIVLHEPYIPGGNDVFTRTDPGAVKVLEATRGLPTCWTPGIPEHERRAAYLERIRLVKEHRVQLEAAPRVLRAEALEYVGSSRVATRTGAGRASDRIGSSGSGRAWRCRWRRCAAWSRSSSPRSTARSHCCGKSWSR